jgi:hypothetical protein
MMDADKDGCKMNQAPEVKKTEDKKVEDKKP